MVPLLVNNPKISRRITSRSDFKNSYSIVHYHFKKREHPEDYADPKLVFGNGNVSRPRLVTKVFASAI